MLADNAIDRATEDDVTRFTADCIARREPCPGVELVTMAPEYYMFLKPLFQTPELNYYVSSKPFPYHTHHKDSVLHLYSIVSQPLKL